MAKLATSYLVEVRFRALSAPMNSSFHCAQNGQLQVGGGLLEIDRDGTVLAGRFSALSHVSSSVEMAVGRDETSCR